MTIGEIISELGDSFGRLTHYPENAHGRFLAEERPTDPSRPYVITPGDTPEAALTGLLAEIVKNSK